MAYKEHHHMSNIPQARNILKELLSNKYLAAPFRAELRKALRLMTRTEIVRQTPHKRHPPTSEQKQKILHLAKTTKLSQAEIARKVGLGSQAGGRVSEILHRSNSHA
jgi:hypothetical protein